MSLHFPVQVGISAWTLRKLYESNKALFYFVLNDKRWAYKLSMIYTGFMAFQGISHNIATIITGCYFDGFAGGYTGIGLVTIGLPLIYVLAKTMPVTRK